MSSYYRQTKHPIYQTFKRAEWLDDYFGRHLYGFRFEGEEKVYDPRDFTIIETLADDGKETKEIQHEDGRKDVNIKVTKLNIDNRTPEDDIAEKKIIDAMSRKTVSILILSKITGDHTFLRDVKQMEVRLVSLQTINAYFKAQKPFTIAKIYWFSLFTYFTHPMNTFQIIEIEDEKKYPVVSTLDL